MGFGVVLVEVVGVVGGDDLDAGLKAQAYHLLVDGVLVADAVAHQLQVEVVAEDLLVLQGHLFGPLVALCTELDVALAKVHVPVHFALQTGRGADEPFAMLTKKLFVDARIVVKPFDIGHGA